MLLVLSGLLISTSSLSNNFYPETPISVYSQEVEKSDLESTYDTNIANLNQSSPEDIKKITRDLISMIIADMLSKVDGPYANHEMGLQIDFPSGWQGTLLKPFNALILTPPELNLTSYITNITESAVNSLINSSSLTDDIPDEKIDQALLSEHFQKLQSVTPQISVSAISKDAIKSLQKLSGIDPPTKSLVSLWYDYPFEASNKIGLLKHLPEINNITGRIKIQSVNHSEINGISTEISVGKSIIPQQINNPFKTLGYLFLTKNNIINVEYINNNLNFSKYLPEIEKSLKSIRVTNPIPINEENIKQFVK